MEVRTIRVAFLVGRDDASTRDSIQAVCNLPGVQPAGILLDTATVALHRRVRTFGRAIRAQGWSYPIVRFIEAIRQVTNSLVNNSVVSQAAVDKVIRQAFPDRARSLNEVAARYAMPLHRAGSLNSQAAIRLLRSRDADLGVVVGTRILSADTFTVPKLGCINLHKGKVPEYRGMPPGFWELYDGVSSAGVTVHFVDKGLDTGDIVATGAVPIAKTETPDSLREKLDQEGARVLVSAVSSIRDGQVSPQPQEKATLKPRTKPANSEIASLARRLPHWRRRGDIQVIIQNLYLLAVYYSGFYFLVKSYRRLSGRSRGAIFLYHRVNNYSKDVLTVDTETFAAQLLAVSNRYRISSTGDIVKRIRVRQPVQPGTIAIHFDDCYRGILTNGAPILKALGIPACAFLASGFIGTARSFTHDETKYPFKFPNLRTGDVQAWVNLGLEIGAHTVNHADLGACPDDRRDFEITQCGCELREITGRPVELFSFPFGRPQNITAAARSAVQQAGYTALFSAHGGFIGPRTEPYDIPRLGVSYESAPLYCLLQIEGLAPGQIADAVASIFNRPRRAAKTREVPCSA